MPRLHRITIWGMGLLVWNLPACGAPPEPPPPPPPPSSAAVPPPAAIMGAIVGQNVVWGDAWVRGDTAIARLYADDGVLMTPEGDVRGRAAIQAWFAERFRTRADTVLSIHTAGDDLHVAGNRAYEAGTLTLTTRPRAASGSTTVRRVRYLAFWEQGPDGVWRILRGYRPL